MVCIALRPWLMHALCNSKRTNLNRKSINKRFRRYNKSKTRNLITRCKDWLNLIQHSRIARWIRGAKINNTWYLKVGADCRLPTRRNSGKLPAACDGTQMFCGKLSKTLLRSGVKRLYGRSYIISTVRRQAGIRNPNLQTISVN